MSQFIRRLACWLGLLGLVCGLDAAPAPALRLVQAQAQITVAGVTRHQTLALPYHWDENNPGQPGEAVFDLPFEGVATGNQPWALVIPKLGNAYEVWLNGELLDRQGDLLHGNGADYSQQPRWINLAPELLATRNLLRVHIRADIGRRGGLAPPLIGPEAVVQAWYRPHYLLTSSAVLVVAIFSLFVGLVSLSLWVTQRSQAPDGAPIRQSIFLYAGVAECAWFVGVGYSLMENPPLPWPWWGLVPALAMATWLVFMSLFCAEAVGWVQSAWMGRFRLVLTLLWLACAPAAWLALGAGHPLALTAWYTCLGIAFGMFMAIFLWQAFRPASHEHRMLALALLLNVTMGFRDILVFRYQPSYGQITWLRYSSVLFGVTLLYILVNRFREAAANAAELLRTLSSRIAERENALQVSYSRLEKLAREQERMAERTRILRDMHDGVGAHLSAAIRQVESGQSNDTELLFTLRDSLDQLKLSIDAMNLPPGDVAGMLANLRYRFGNRFALAGLQLQWRVGRLEPIERLDGQAMRHLQFIVYAAFSNTLQHANATTLVVEADPTEVGISLLLSDNGKGFDTSLPAVKGRRLMRERAVLIGATLVEASGSQGSAVRLEIPH